MVEVKIRKITEFGAQNELGGDSQGLLATSLHYFEGIKNENDINTLHNYGIRPIYVPYCEVPRPERMPNIVNIVDSKTRVYLQPAKHAVTLNYRENEAQTIHSHKQTDIHTEFDLGMEPLQKIVYKMRRLHAEGNRPVFDKDAIRAAGVMSYCKYLIGRTPAPKLQRTLKNKKVKGDYSALKTK